MTNDSGKKEETGKLLMRGLFDAAMGEVSATLFEERPEEAAKKSRARLKSLAKKKLKGLIDALFAEEKSGTDKKVD